MLAHPESRIRSALAGVERDHEVRIVYACESGSRAWGFASTDSDYDVRFLCVHGPEWYLSVDPEHRRDVIELPIADDLDVNGWDVRKALRLFRKSNPPLTEWLGSPIVYHEGGHFAARLRELTRTFHNPLAARYHYLRMAGNNFREFLRGPVVKPKKYFYVLRPILAVKWIEAGLGVVPTEFSRLVKVLLPAGELRDAVEALLARKRAGAEGDVGPRIEPISAYIEGELARAEAECPTLPAPTGDPEVLDELFRETVSGSWGP